MPYLNDDFDTLDAIAADVDRDMKCWLATLDAVGIHAILTDFWIHLPKLSHLPPEVQAALYEAQIRLSTARLRIHHLMTVRNN